MKFCPYCGSNILAPDANYCHECGKALDPNREPRAVEATFNAIQPFENSVPLLTRKLKRLSTWFWLGCIALVGLMSAWVIPALTGSAYGGKRDGFLVLDVLLIIAGLNAYLFRRVGRNGWVGFGVGLATGLAFLVCLRTAIDGYRSTITQQSFGPTRESRPWEKFQQSDRASKPNPFDQFDPKRDPTDPLGLFPKEPASNGLVPFDGELDKPKD